MQKFTLIQRNNLVTGMTLVAELASVYEDHRAFVTLWASKGASRFLNTVQPEKIVFCLRRYDVKCAYIDNDWDVTDDELTDSVHLVDIKGLSTLESVLSVYLDDFAKLDGSWRRDNPL